MTFYCLTDSSGYSLPWRVGDAEVGGRGVEKGAVGLASSDGLSHSVVDFQNNALGAVLAVFLLILALDDGEGFHDVVYIVAGDAVKVEVGSIEFTAQQKAPLFVLAE